MPWHFCFVDYPDQIRAFDFVSDLMTIRAKSMLFSADNVRHKTIKHTMTVLLVIGSISLLMIVAISISLYSFTQRLTMVRNNFGRNFREKREQSRRRRPDEPRPLDTFADRMKRFNKWLHEPDDRILLLPSTPDQRSLT